MTNKRTKQQLSEIIGMQFSILSPEQIRNMSVAEITSRDTYINNKPVVGGIFDPRMGVLDSGLICPTDGHNNIISPGYFGHIELARPVLYIQYLSTILKILRVICYKCSKLLMCKKSNEKILSNESGEKRWNKIFQLASKIKRCGDDTECGCGCKQPSKIKKEGLATILMEWNNLEVDDNEDNNNVIIKLNAESILKIFSRISNDDIDFMGFSSVFSRPEWMICQVFAVPPPAVRPSVKHNVQQRSEDDLSHIIINILKANKTLKEKIESNANGQIIDDWTMMLQYYIATMVDNNITGVASVAQRSGRPLKSIKERLNGKIGRVRGNLMGKRVDYSARSVITPDPNLSIWQLGVPLKIAMNLTKPVTVNKMNYGYLLGLVKAGPDKFPGAKILQRFSGENISLKFIDRESIALNYGDIVHRHLVDDDCVLFNRQPTLHRMSMMCHKVKVMKQGNTFRMNVAVTKPYNADFDGDEMNLHMPQDLESENELKSLAAVPNHIISPANNQSIIGIFQDSLLGTFEFTKKDVTFSKRKAMNLLMNYKYVDERLFETDTAEISNFDILSQILPAISLKYKTKLFNDNEDIKTSNYVFEVLNGKLLRGNIDKAVLGSSSKGLIQRIYNDFGSNEAMMFIDNLQNIITDFMKEYGYSVGISDLIANQVTYKEIINIISKKKVEVQHLINQTHLGTFENKTGQSNVEEFEMQVNSILNAAASEAGKIGRMNLDTDNRFIRMVNAGSKGSDINISQMIATLGQQNVDGKRIPYGYDSRTLPHFHKYDDSPEARGFVQSSFIEGLTAYELFFHAQGGRVGLIDTAVKTSTTGYLQRRLIKGMEDLKVYYDYTVRNNKDKIVQYNYGDDSADATRIESQQCDLVKMSLEDMYQYFNIPHDKAGYLLFTKQATTKMKRQKKNMMAKCKEIIDNMVENRELLIKNVFNHMNENKIYLPIAFQFLINNCKHQAHIQSNSLIDITPLDAMQLIDKTFEKLGKYTYNKPTQLLKIMYYYHLFPSNILLKHRFNKATLEYLLVNIEKIFIESMVAPGEMVGIIAAQSIGEPTTQMTLNTFHFAGVASKSNVTKGVPRVEEILSLSSNPKKPSLTIYLNKKDQTERMNAINIMNTIENIKLEDLVKQTSISFDPNNNLYEQDNAVIQNYLKFEELFNDTNDKIEYNKWVLRLEMDRISMLEKNITMDDIHFAIYNSYQNEIECVYSDYNENELVFRLRMKNSNKIMNSKNNLDQTDEIYKLNNFKQWLLTNLTIRGVKHIEKVILRKDPNTVIYDMDRYKRKDIWVLDTIGTNLIDILALPNIDSTRTISNSIMEVYKVLGIEAARKSIYNEFIEVLSDNDTYINERHLTLLCDRMTYSTILISIFRHGINNDNIGPIAKASFEETPEQFLKAARHAELDPINGVSAAVMCGQEGFYGTNAFSTLLDLDYLKDLKTATKMDNDNDYTLDDSDEDDLICNTNSLALNAELDNIDPDGLGCIDDDYDINI